LQIEQIIAQTLSFIKDFNFNAMCLEIENLRKYLTIFGSSSQQRFFLEKLFESPLFEALLSLIIPEFYSHFEILTEIFWFLSNVSVYSKKEEIVSLIKLGLFDKCIDIVHNSKFDILIHDVYFLN